jgi:hypothetical protein
MKKIFGISLLQYVVLFVSLVLVFFLMREAELRESVRAFGEMIQLLEQWINDPHEVAVAHQHDIYSHLKQLYEKKGLRFTLIRGDGIVLIDGAIKKHKEMDNHLSRPEIQDALVHGRGVAVRHSQSMDRTLLYVAEPIKTPWGTLYLRLSAPPDIVRHNSITFFLMAVVAVTSIVMVKLC